MVLIVLTPLVTFDKEKHEKHFVCLHSGFELMRYISLAFTSTGIQFGDLV